MRVNHRAAAGDVADQQDHEDAVENQCSRRCLRPEVEITVNQVDGISANQYSPAAGVGSMTIDDCDKSERKNPSQRPQTRRGYKERDNPDRDVSDNLIEQSD